jgi:hypothetical protein
MAIALEATSQADQASATSLSWSHTCTGSDRCLYVHAWYEGNTAPDIAATYNGVAMTRLSNLDQGNAVACAVFRLVAPATGANTVVVDLGGVTRDLAGFGRSYTGVHQTTPEQNVATNLGLDTSPTVTVTSQTDDLVLDFISVASTTTYTPGSGQTQEEYYEPVNFTARLCGSREPGAASVVMDATLGTSRRWATTGLSVIPAAVVETLTCAPGAYTVTGAGATPQATCALVATPGSLAITGQPCTPALGFPAAAGVYALTGAAAPLLSAYLLTAPAGSYLVTGRAATLVSALMVSAAPGLYTLSGVDMAWVLGLAAAAGVYVLTGQAAVFVEPEGAALVCSPGTYLVAGVSLAPDVGVSLAPGAYAVTGTALVPSLGASLPAGGYSVSGVAATLRGQAHLLSTPGAYALSGPQAGLLAHYTVALAPGTYLVTGDEATVLAHALLSALAGGYAVQGQDAALLHGLTAPELIHLLQLALRRGTLGGLALDWGTLEALRLARGTLAELTID